MLKNYLRLSFRKIMRDRGFSVINLIGLAVGMAACLLILFWLQDEFDFDKFNKNYDSIYRVIHEQKFDDHTIHSAKAPVPLGPTLVEDFPEIINSTRFGTFVGEVMIEYEENAYYELGGAYVDPSYFEIFTINLLQGDRDNIFPDRFSIIITESTAKKYFGDENPIGKSLELENIVQLKVTGIIEDIPDNSHLHFDFAVPFTLYEAWGADLTDWSSWPTYTYIQVTHGTSMQKLNEKISSFIQDKIPNNTDEIYLQPLKKIHLYSNFAYDSPAILGDINNIYIFTSIGFFILVIACINFVNLTTAGSLKRAREIGLRKVLGANRNCLIRQFLGETILLTIIAAVLSMILIELAMPHFNQLTGKNLMLNLSDVRIIIGAFLIILFTGLFSGLYPAFFLSSFKPAKTLKGTLKFGDKNQFLRKGLIVFQFFLSVTLIVCTMIVFKQLKFIQNKKLGYNTDNVICIQSRPGMYRNYRTFKENLLRNPRIIDVSATSEERCPIPLTPGSFSWPGKNSTESPSFALSEVDYDYFKTMQIELVRGRSFSKDMASDSSSVVVNEAAVRAMRMNDPVGEQLNLNGKSHTIIGVNKDVHLNSLHHSIEPVITRIYTYLPFSIFIRVGSSDLSKSLKIIEKEWYKIVPGFPFVYTFLDERVAEMYKYEKKISKIFTFFAFLAIFISCLGLFGLATFTTDSRTKEIGLRKVLGSSSREIVFLLSKDFTKWVLLGTLIAWPVAWFGMKFWLQSFAYRVHIGFWVFVASGILALLIAFITISFRTIKAATANPINSIKYE